MRDVFMPGLLLHTQTGWVIVTLCPCVIGFLNDVGSMAAFEPPRDNEHRVDCTRAATVEYARQVIDRFKRNDSNVALPTCNKFGYLQFCIKSGMQYAV